MIRALVMRRHTYTIEYMPGGALHDYNDLVIPLPYETAAATRSLPSGCYIFSDMDRLLTGGMTVVRQLHASLSRHPGCTVLNDPSRSLTRLPLLNKLEEAGLNDFRARPLKRWRELRFPMFIREVDEHNGPATALLNSPEQVRRVIPRLALMGLTSRHLMAVEYVDTSDEGGLYRKYSCFLVGDRMVAHHLVFKRDWVAKVGASVNKERAEEEAAFVRDNPHEELLRPIFELAEIRFGRIDYAFAGGRPVVWEINLNPQLGIRRPLPGQEYREPTKALARTNLRNALAELDGSTAPATPEPIPIDVDRAGRARFTGERGLIEARRRWLNMVEKARRHGANRDPVTP